MEPSVRRNSFRRRAHLQRVASFAAAALVGGALLAAPASAEPAKKPASSCVACHTDAERLKAEAATIPAPPASALQAGKG